MIHLIGIKGSGMSALACLLHDRKESIQGSDINDSLFTEHGLQERGIRVVPFGTTSYKKNDIVIIGNAFSDNHEEVKNAKKAGSLVTRYHDARAALASETPSIAISGTHGKTTTTGWMSHVFKHQRPIQYLIGDGTGKGESNPSHFVFEACEYKNHFLSYSPDYVFITNVEWDHPDYFTSYEQVKEAFLSFGKRAKKAVIVCGEDAQLVLWLRQKGLTVYTYGLNASADLYASAIKTDEKGTSFRVGGRDLGNHDTVFIPFHGNHQILNALAVLFASDIYGLNREKTLASLATFPGVKRRFELSKAGTNVIVNDYAHHPTEIKATLDSVQKRFPKKTIVAIFQPHTYTRTEAFRYEFEEALKAANEVYLCDIFGSAREGAGNVNAKEWASASGFHFLSEKDVTPLLSFEESVLCFMGAGDIEKHLQAYTRQKKAT